MPAASTVPRAPPRPAMRLEGAIRAAPGSTRPATCGCSAGMATAQPAVWAPLMICGYTVPAQGYGPRSVVAARTTPPAPTARRARSRPAPPPGRARRRIPGPTPRAICGYSVGRAMVQAATAISTICGNLYRRSDKNEPAPSRGAKSIRESVQITVRHSSLPEYCF